jgi:sugar lactone lactonase YvrE
MLKTADRAVFKWWGKALVMRRSGAVVRAAEHVVLVVGVMFAVLTLAGSASAYSTASGFSATDYATGFPSASCCGWGPIGVAFDSSDNLYVADVADGHIYRFQPGGGASGAATRLTADPLSGGIKGLAFGRDGRLYLARGKAGDVVEINPATGAIKRTVASDVPCATGLAVDPKSGDLFVSQDACQGGVVRVSGFADGPGTVKPYAVTPCCADGLTFAPDGTLYAGDGGHVLQIAGTTSSTPGATRSIASVPHADGVAIGVPSAGQDPFVVVNRTDGEVTKVDFSQFPPTQTTIVSGGTRGDFVAVDSRGCLFATQTSSVARITPPGRGCDLAPTTPGALPAPGIVIETVAGAADEATKGGKCVVRHRLVVRVRQRGRVRLRVVRVYVSGKHRKTLRHRRVSAPITIRHLPRGKFTVKLVARTTHGRKLTARKRFRNCTRQRSAAR